MSAGLKLYHALFEYNSGDPSDLRFSAGAVILVTDDNNGEPGWWQGEVNGQPGVVGNFPSNYVAPMQPRIKAFVAPEDQDPRDPFAPAAPAALARKVVMREDRNEVANTFTSAEYDRKGDFNANASHNEWLKEEEEEKARQLEVRWQYMERLLPAGGKCAERLHSEQLKAEKERKEREAQDAAAARRAEQKKKLMQARAAKQGITLSDADMEAERAQAADSRGAAPPPPPPASGADAGASAASDRAERLRRLAEQRKERSFTLAPAPAPAPAGTDAAPAVLPVVNALADVTARLAKLDAPVGPGKTGFDAEFKMLDEEDKTIFRPELCAAALKNPRLNRYNDILPYDTARVVLNPTVPNNDQFDYINACVVRNLLPGAPEFICAQGPLPDTVAHFWKMIAQNRSQVVVMLTRVREDNRPKCAEYWGALNEKTTFPANASGPQVSVTMTGEFVVDLNTVSAAGVVGDKLGDYFRRELTVESVDAAGAPVVFTCVQLHFVTWPDHGVPTDASFILFLQHTQIVQAEAQKAAGLSVAPPMIVHCSAGVGRTGVFCCTYAATVLLPTLLTTKAVTPPVEFDVLKMVRTMRACRRYMVQTVAQYRFCFVTIKELLENGARGVFGGAIPTPRALQPTRVTSPPPAAGSAAGAAAPAPASPRSPPVFVFLEESQDQASAALLRSPAPGLFLLMALPPVASLAHRLLVVTANLTVAAFELTVSDGTFLLDSKPMSKCANVWQVVQALSQPNAYITQPLTSFAARAGVTPAELERDTAQYGRILASLTAAKTPVVEDAAAARYRELAATFEAATQQIAQLNAQVASLRGAESKLSAAVSSLMAENAVLKSENAALRANTGTAAASGGKKGLPTGVLWGEVADDAGDDVDDDPYVALESFLGAGTGELALTAGEEVFVIAKNYNGDEQWWHGTTLDGRTGIFPARLLAVKL